MPEISVTDIPKRMSIFEQASCYTLDSKLRALLLECSKAKWPSQFRVEGNKIRTNKGLLHPIPRDPMDLCNLIHDILHDQDMPPVPVIPESRVSNRNANDLAGISPASIYAFAGKESRRLGLGDLHREKLAACIFTGILTGHLEAIDFSLNGECILSINKIDTKIPDLI